MYLQMNSIFNHGNYKNCNFIYIYLQEKLKALKYIHCNKEKSAVAVSILEQPINRDAFMNDLHIKIIRGINLKSRQKSKVAQMFVCLDFTVKSFDQYLFYIV